MREKLIKTRILHLSLLFAVSIFVYQYTQWEDGLWIPISVLAIMGPFRPGLAINKAGARILGTLAGLIISLVVWVIMRYSYNLMFIYAIIAAYCVAFAMLQEYRYFILVVTVILCINFNYMNPQYYNEFYYIINRGICVLTGVSLFLFAEYFIFKPFYANALVLVTHEKINEAVNQSISDFIQLCESNKQVHALEITKCYTLLLTKLDALKEIKASISFGYSEQEQTIALIDRYLKILNEILVLYAKLGFSIMHDKNNIPEVSITRLYQLCQEVLL